MTDVSPFDPQRWMRLQFPEINKRIDDGAAPDFELLASEALAVAQALGTETATATDARADQSCVRERFTYISMIHAALYRHKRAMESATSALPPSFAPAMAAVESLMIEMAAKIGVEHRFLSSFYLLYNPEVDGRHAQFLPGKDEVEFLRTNHTGMLLFKKAALALLDAAHDTRDPRHGGSSTSRAMARLPFESPREAFNEATEAFTKIVELNRALAQSLDQQEFRRMTEYFGTVDVRGRILRGVNAGDQPWSYIIDLLFGVDLKRVFEVAFARKYPPHIQNAAQALAYEFETSEAGYLRASYLLPEDYIALTETIQLVSTASAFILHPSSFILSPETVQVYLMTSNTHYGLAKKYVPIDPHTGTQIGSSGTNIDTFLKTLIEERRRALDKLTQVDDRSSTSLIPHS